MKKIFKKLAGLMMGLLVIGGLAGIGAGSNEAPVIAEAASPWVLRGSKIGWSSNDVVLEYSSQKYSNFVGDPSPYYGIERVFAQNETFKIVNTTENEWYGYSYFLYNGSVAHNKVPSNAFTKDGDDNFKCLKSGTYRIYIANWMSKNNDGKPYGFAIEEVKSVSYKVTHYNMDGSVLSSKTVIENSEYNPEFKEIEGYRLEGWYTDKTLTNKIKKGTKVTGNLNLYPKYVEAKDFTTYFYHTNNNLGTDTIYAYMYRNNFDGGVNNAWPGVAITKDSNDSYIIPVDASKSFDTIIFNAGNGNPQTVDISMIDSELSIYVLTNTKDAEGKYKCDARTVTAATSNEGKTAGYYTVSGTTYTLVNYIANAQKQIAFEKYMADLDTCGTYENVGEYLTLSEGLDTTVTITEENGNKVTIKDKLDYMETKKEFEAAKSNPSPLGNNLLSNISSNNNIAIILIIGLLGLATIGGYYYLNKKKYAK